MIRRDRAACRRNARAMLHFTRMEEITAVGLPRLLEQFLARRAISATDRFGLPVTTGGGLKPSIYSARDPVSLRAPRQIQLLQSLRLTPRRDPGQRALAWSITAPGRRLEQVDAYGNISRTSSSQSRAAPRNRASWCAAWSEPSTRKAARMTALFRRSPISPRRSSPRRTTNSRIAHDAVHSVRIRAPALSLGRSRARCRALQSAPATYMTARPSPSGAA